MEASCRRRISTIKRYSKRLGGKYSAKHSTKHRKYIIIAGWLAIWQLIAFVLDNHILLATPLETAGELLRLIGERDFYAVIGRSLFRIALGFGTGFAVAVLLALCSSRVPVIEEILNPAMTLIKAVPVASFAVLLLIWWGSSFLAVAVCFTVVLPNLYINLLEGLKATDIKMLEMAQVFRLSLRNRFFYIYRPSLKPFLHSGLKLSLGMCWKSGVAAEVIGTPDFSIGERLYLSKVYLDTAGIFAWTAVVVGLSVLFEKVVLWLLERFFTWEPACRKAHRLQGKERAAEKGERLTNDIPIKLTDVTKSYDGRAVVDCLNMTYEPGGTYYLTSPSGSGKTTLLRILARLTEPDSGQVAAPPRCSMAFQEDRLCEDYSAVKNVELVTGDRKRAQEALNRLLEQEALQKPCRQLSGGERRRVALVRAMEAHSAYVLLDEPYAGMDADTRQRAQIYIQERQAGRTVIIADHFMGGSSA